MPTNLRCGALALLMTAITNGPLAQLGDALASYRTQCEAFVDAFRIDCGGHIDMPDTPIAGSGGHDYPADMEARVRVLEEIAASTKAILGDIRAEQRSGIADLRTELRAMRADIAAVDQRRERDFRITFGAIITTTLGLAFLIARTAHSL